MLLQNILGHHLSLLDKARKERLLDCAMEAAIHRKGDFAEFGVYRGGSAIIIATALAYHNSPFKLHLFDSWLGLPSRTSMDHPRLKAGILALPKESTERNLQEYGVIDRCVFHDGIFSDTLPKFSTPLAFAHIDCDLYEGTKLCLEHVLPLLTDDGIIIVDDCSPRFPGVQKAVRECLPSNWNLSVLGGRPDQSVLLRRKPGNS